MNVLLLGNGFDLYHKLPTTYLSFLTIAEYLAKHNQIPPTYELFFDEVKNKCRELDDSFTIYKDLYLSKNVFSNEDFYALEQFQDIIQHNEWANYFLSMYNSDLSWIDFEKEINKVIIEFKRINTDFKFVQRIGEIRGKNNSKIFKQFKKYFTVVEKHLVLNFKFTKESTVIDNLLEVDMNKIFENLYLSLLSFEDAFKIYLNYFIEKPLLNSKTEFIERNSVFNKFNKVITFNYTNTFEKLYNGEVYHIHGNIDKQIVMGINPTKDDELDELDTSTIMFKKYYQRILFRTDNEFFNEFGKETVPSHGIDNLIVSGHSLDVTDQDIIKTIFKKSKNTYILFHSQSALSNYIKNLISIYGKKEFDIFRAESNLKFITYDALPDINLTNDLGTKAFVY